MTATMTIGELLRDAAEKLRRGAIDDADLEADVLLRHALVLGDDRAHLLARLRDPVDAAAARRFSSLLRRRLAHEPTAYIVGAREFFGLKLGCSPDALIPRPETELLVELGLEWLTRPGGPSRPLVVDVGTGTGALAIALAVHAPAARVVAIDTSAGALRLARRNALSHGVVYRVRFVRADLLAALRTGADRRLADRRLADRRLADRRLADLIVANLPYVSEPDWEALPPEIRAHEPRSALVGGRAGTETIARLLAQAPAHMAPRSLLLCECGDREGDALRADAARAFPTARIDVRQDLAGLDRVLRIEL